ncbi:MAG TPA: carboxypeptidase-like regulatory domain-containing protein, partial [Pyrinomonadaceae bacterium]|nr:carboxypeptidase-like regulatory domain-containing protein [Pyrinomonadaceae bacterium]
MINRIGPVRSCTRKQQSCTTALCCILFAAIPTFAQQHRISGVVSDANGAAIPNASVEFEANGTSVRTATDVEGNFTVLSTESFGTLSISSPGFNTIRIDVSRPNGPLRIRLDPAGVIERIVVTADDDRIPSTPTSQFTIGQK